MLQRHGDAWGFFSERWNHKTLCETGLELTEFVPDNYPMSAKVSTAPALTDSDSPFTYVGPFYYGAES